MSNIQQVLPTDSFEDLVGKLNEVIRYADESLTQAVANAYKLQSDNLTSISNNTEDIEYLKEYVSSLEMAFIEFQVDADTQLQSLQQAVDNLPEVTSEEMKEYIESLYASRV